RHRVLDVLSSIHIPHPPHTPPLPLHDALPIFIRMRRGKGKDWLLVKKNDDYAIDADVTDDDRSVASKRRLGNARPRGASPRHARSEEHTSELQSRGHLVCRLLLEKKKK